MHLLQAQYQKPFKDNGACIFGPGLEDTLNSQMTEIKQIEREKSRREHNYS